MSNLPEGCARTAPLRAECGDGSIYLFTGGRGGYTWEHLESEPPPPPVRPLGYSREGGIAVWIAIVCYLVYRRLFVARGRFSAEVRKRAIAIVVGDERDAIALARIEARRIEGWKRLANENENAARRLAVAKHKAKR